MPLADRTIYILEETGHFSADGSAGMGVVISQKRGDTRRYKIYFLDSGGNKVAPDAVAYHFVAKASAGLDGAAILTTTGDAGAAVTVETDADGDDYLQLVLSPADAVEDRFEAVSAAGRVETVDLSGELTWVPAGETGYVSSGHLRIRVSNDVAKLADLGVV
jgi:hypothetical protein